MYEELLAFLPIGVALVNKAIKIVVSGGSTVKMLTPSSPKKGP